MTLEIPVEKLKSILIEDGVLKEADFDSAKRDAKRMSQSLSDILISRNLITEDYYENLLSNFYGVPRINLLGNPLDESLITLLPENIAREKRAIIFGKSDRGEYLVAMEDPSDLETIEFLNQFLKGKIIPYLSTRESLNVGFSYYVKRSSESFRKMIEDSVRASLRKKLGDSKEAAEELPVVALVDNLIAYAISSRASDIHIEILEDSVLIRFRVDGVLKEIIRVPKEIHAAILARLKLLGSLKLDEHSRPQDGRFRYKLVGELMDIRLAIMPTFYGEKAEMRLLASTERPLSLEELGFFPDHVAIIKKTIKKTYGLILMTGPTGSGKTTTMYSILSMLNKPEVNIVTIEDPVEYDMKYINQTQINPTAGITFASGLREIVRQDPNVIMVGEIRDEETADICVQAALTGHLVLSSLHTNDASTAIPRFIDLKVAPFLLSAVINLIQAQRLVRRICLECISSYIPEESLLSSLKNYLSPDSPVRLPSSFFKGKGCPACGGTGYKGRIGIFELLDVSDKEREVIVSPHFTLDSLRAEARKSGMITMFEDGLRKVEKGITTPEEVLRVIRE